MHQGDEQDEENRRIRGIRKRKRVTICIMKRSRRKICMKKKSMMNICIRKRSRREGYIRKRSRRMKSGITIKQSMWGF